MLEKESEATTEVAEDVIGIGVLEEDDDDKDLTSVAVEWTIVNDAMVWKEDIDGYDDENDGCEEYEYQSKEELEEASQLMKLVEGKSSAIPELISSPKMSKKSKTR